MTIRTAVSALLFPILPSIRHDNTFLRLAYKISTVCPTRSCISRYFLYTITLSSSQTTMEPFSKPCKTSDPPAYTATDKTAQYLQPFFPSCLTKYPNALKFFRETSDLYCIVAKPQTCTCHPTVCYRYTTERPLEKYYFTDLKYGKRTVS